MPREWGPSGAMGLQPIEIGTAKRQQINTELRSKGFVSEAPSLFFLSISIAVGRFNAIKEIIEGSKPADVRKNLKAAIEAANQLFKKLDDLDLNSCQLIAEVNHIGISKLQGGHTIEIIRTLEKAYLLADEYPTKGRLQENHRLQLAIDVAHSIQKYLEVKPTSTKEGVYESILNIVLEIATNKTVKSVHDLARKALNEKNLQPSEDLTEYYLPKDD